MAKIGKGDVDLTATKIRDAANYGGKVFRNTTFAGVAVERFAAPVRFSLNQEAFSFSFELWEDVSDFEASRPSIAENRREFAGRIADYSQFAPFFEAIGTGAIEFLNLDSNFEMVNIYIDALDLSITVSASHKIRPKYQVSDSISGFDAFNSVKSQYLDSIVLPFFAMAWTLAAGDRNLSKFE